MMDYQKAQIEWDKIELDMQKCTCLNCTDKENCPYVYELYNYDGDCIMEE